MIPDPKMGPVISPLNNKGPSFFLSYEYNPFTKSFKMIVIMFDSSVK